MPKPFEAAYYIRFEWNFVCENLSSEHRFLELLLILDDAPWTTLAKWFAAVAKVALITSIKVRLLYEQVANCSYQ